MLKRKSLAVGMAALLATAASIQPVAAQYGGYYNNQYDNRYGDPYDNRYNDYYSQQNDYNRQQSQYERDRQYYERERARQYGGYDYGPGQNPYGQNYGQNYGYSTQYDDPYYRECRQQRSGNQVAGLIIGGALGAALGSTIARGPARGGGTALGAILGGALGATVGGRSLNCDDRNYLYQTSYSGFERGVPRRTYRWRNPQSGNYGEFYVGDYYRGQRGLRCATYSQTIWVDGRPVPATGHACRQPDGNWVIVD